MLQGFFLLTLLVAFAQAEGDCLNPMFSYTMPIPLNPRGLNFTLLSSPQTQESFGACHNLDGELSCCNKDIFYSIIPKSTYAAYLIADTVVSNFLYNVSHFDSTTVINNVLNYLNVTLNENQFPYAVQMLQKLVQVIDPLVTCYGSLVGYQQGVMCLACHPQWATVFNPDTNTVAINQATCNSVFDGCQDAIKAVGGILDSEINLLIKLLQAADEPDLPLIGQLEAFEAKLQNQSLCQLTTKGNCPEGDCCKSMICHEMMKGPVIGFEVLRILFKDNFYGNYSTNYTNVYSSEGYQAYEVGCGSALSGYACRVYVSDSDDSSSNKGVIIAVVVVLLVLLLAVGGYFLRKRLQPPAKEDDLSHYAPLN